MIIISNISIDRYYMSLNLEEKQPSQSIPLKLGDVIEIKNPSNEILNNQKFLIHYIDNSKIKLIDIENKTTAKLKIDDDGTLSDKSIENIFVIYRNKENGYARQNDLLPGKWINIYFNGDVPFILSAEITNIENDMIEITSYPNK